ncbi:MULTISPECIES: Gfo/Idh/MocA family protein [unclassified Haloferax]|uniref:Gfo/Idh/MocA family oxidoreductase n=1 Tax=Haloferax sp. Atlit-48N TaxID=2077198 RepID=A0ACD5I0E8_9EURY|nr:MULTISPECIES: Gfo/Idh/MocA family oxidoreductase [unclassified Haloferax]RDZ30654.1 gfo/Idh/MocA family oxidoreductase [Haloferax sp. Atlit-48N]RDZ33692.1 gfo/Idh/MocA family oxidoreductase [Haloferax sp. Atlit-24N]RDZ35983.1 gfo/Idh/MocA family oxidoreductase [Haloferax sp. Atlit-47N]RLM34216.1 gfo/Idh/MocA family oxidoreductase [Haloferax sp. Atlit-109R]RLM41037.1 gfo/Idh/MocA family oxidoreductase [Haloferax sp. Atlit-105R]
MSRKSAGLRADGGQERPVRAGVVGVGSMGTNHARVYAELRGVELVGVADADADRAAEVAADFGTDAYGIDGLLDRVDVVTVAVPTPYHASVARQCIDAGVHALVEKPFVDDLGVGAELAALAEDRGVVLQVGHIERFNPAVRALPDLLDGVEPIAITANRLGPPLNREMGDGVVMDLMIHDIDVVLSLVDAEVDRVAATATPDEQYATAQVTFDNGVIASLTASRLTQQKTRTLDITARDRLIRVDYLNQSVQIFRQSRPDYLRDNGGVRYRHEVVMEQPMISTGEPLKRELQAFVDAATDGGPVLVSPADGLRAIDLARRIEADAESTVRSVETAETAENAETAEATENAETTEPSEGRR